MAKPDKPRPHLIDALDPRLSDPESYKKIVALRPRARRFVFDEEASRYAGHFIRDCGDLLIANRQFALPPYEVTYIQYDIDTLIKAIGRRSSHDWLGEAGRDLTVGYLIHGNAIYSMFHSDGSEPATGIFSYTVNAPAGGPIFGVPIKDNDPTDQWPRLALLLGSTCQDIAHDETTQLDIARNIHIRYTRPLSVLRGVSNSEADYRRRCLQVVLASAGDYRNCLTLLLLLNQKKRVTYEHVPWRRSLLKGKRFVYAAHNVVKIHLRPKESIRRALSPTLHVPRRRHDVMAHFAHYNLGEGCEHQWPLVPEVSEDGVPRWECQRCHGLRVRRRAHERGRADIGQVDKDYTVTE